MAILSKARMLKSMRKTPLILMSVLRDVSEAQAGEARDGDDGWNVIEIVCHLRDFEEIFFDRAQRIVNEDRPKLMPYDHLKLAIDNYYAGQELDPPLQHYRRTREKFLEWLEELPDEAWFRLGVHPEQGEFTLMEQTLQVFTHDLDHLEQITRILEG